MTITQQTIRGSRMHVLYINGKASHAYPSWRLALMAMLEALV